MSSNINMYDQKGRHGKERLRRYLMNRITKGKRQQKIGNERKKKFFGPSLITQVK